MITVKQYAESRNKSVQAVYQAMKRKNNKVLLEGHVKREDGATWLDNEAVRILDEGRSQQAIVVVPPDMELELKRIEIQAQETIDRIKRELQQEIFELKEEKDELKEEKRELKEEKRELKEEKRELNEENKELKKEIEALKEALNKEKSKSWWDKLRGK